jgi:hypothetical protein
MNCESILLRLIWSYKNNMLFYFLSNKNLVAINPLLFKSASLCFPLIILWCFRTSLKIKKCLMLLITVHVLCF